MKTSTVSLIMATILGAMMGLASSVWAGNGRLDNNINSEKECGWLEGKCSGDCSTGGTCKPLAKMGCGCVK